MNTYISLLRGINVSGQKMIKMELLRALYEELGFKEVKSYIQSGNVIFKADGNPSDLASQIKNLIAERLSFDVPVMVKEWKEWEEVLVGNPFLLDRKEDKKYLHVTFLSDIPSNENIAKIKGGQYGADEYVLVNKTLYLFCPNGYGNTKLSNNFFENKLKVLATTRNWNSMEKIAELCRG